MVLTETIMKLLIGNFKTKKTKAANSNESEAINIAITCGEEDPSKHDNLMTVYKKDGTLSSSEVKSESRTRNKSRGCGMSYM